MRENHNIERNPMRIHLAIQLVLDIKLSPAFRCVIIKCVSQRKIRCSDFSPRSTIIPSCRRDKPHLETFFFAVCVVLIYQSVNSRINYQSFSVKQKYIFHNFHSSFRVFLPTTRTTDDGACVLYLLCVVFIDKPLNRHFSILDFEQ